MNDQQSSDRAAPEDVIKRFIGSYGVRATLMSMFASRELAQAQLLSREFYTKRISDV